MLVCMKYLRLNNASCREIVLGVLANPKCGFPTKVLHTIQSSLIVFISSSGRGKPRRKWASSPYKWMAASKSSMHVLHGTGDVHPDDSFRESGCNCGIVESRIFHVEDQLFLHDQSTSELSEMNPHRPLKSQETSFGFSYIGGAFKAHEFLDPSSCSFSM